MNTKPSQRRSNKLFAIILIALFGTTAIAVNAQVCTPAPVGLVSWWSGDSNALDGRSRNNGMLQNGATYGSSEVG